jgi:MFS family permease
MRTKINSLYIIAFLFNLHLAIPAYVNSTFLNQIIAERFVGLVYTVGSALTVLGLIYLPKALSKYGNYFVSMTVLILDISAIFALAITKEPILILIAMGLSFTLSRIVVFNNDIFLENLSTDGETGEIRGFFLSASNLAWVISPAIAGFILEQSEFAILYFTAALVAVPVVFIFADRFKRFDDPVYDHPPFWKTLREILRRKNLKRVVMTNVMLRFFFAIMVIYAPIYLREHIGFEWSEIGLMFTIMLLPFVLLEIPLGKIADQVLGEKELLISGFIIIAVSTAFLSFITEASFWLWAGALFMTRVGASMLEVMSETYFFKKIDGRDSNLLSFFRMTGPFAYIIAPLVATIILPFIGIKYIFLVLGVVMLYGLKYSYNLEDTL